MWRNREDEWECEAMDEEAQERPIEGGRERDGRERDDKKVGKYQKIKRKIFTRMIEIFLRGTEAKGRGRKRKRVSKQQDRDYQFDR